MLPKESASRRNAISIILVFTCVRYGVTEARRLKKVTDLEQAA